MSIRSFLGRAARRVRQGTGDETVSFERTTAGFDAAHLHTSKRRWPDPLVSTPQVPARTLAVPDDEIVIGFERDGDARVYPTSMLADHHLAHEDVGGPVLITFCARCFSAVGFDPVVDGTALRFHVYGGYEGALVIQDDQTGTLWSQMTGGALAGPLAGTRLELLPVEMTTFSRWLARHPDSTTPDPAAISWAARMTPGQPMGEKWAATVSNRDDRLPPRSLVLGVRTERGHRAYQLDPLNPGPRVHQDLIGDVPIVLLAPSGGWPLAFDRRSADGVVEFREEDGSIVGDKGSRWTAEGLAMDGVRRGVTLRFVTSHVTEWYAWAASHPGSDIVKLSAVGSA